MFLMMVLFALENVRCCFTVIITINFGFILGLMDYYNAEENNFPINVKFHFFSAPPLSLPHVQCLFFCCKNVQIPDKWVDKFSFVFFTTSDT